MGIWGQHYPKDEWSSVLGFLYLTHELAVEDCRAEFSQLQGIFTWLEAVHRCRCIFLWWWYVFLCRSMIWSLICINKICYFGGKDSEVIKFNLGSVSYDSFVGTDGEIIWQFEPGEGFFVDDVLSILLERIERLVIFPIGWLCFFLVTDRTTFWNLFAVIFVEISG